MFRFTRICARAYPHTYKVLVFRQYLGFSTSIRRVSPKGRQYYPEGKPSLPAYAYTAHRRYIRGLLWTFPAEKSLSLMRIEWSLVLRLYIHREQGFLLVGHARHAPCMCACECLDISTPKIALLSACQVVLSLKTIRGIKKRRYPPVMPIHPPRRGV